MPWHAITGETCVDENPNHGFPWYYQQLAIPIVYFSFTLCKSKKTYVLYVNMYVCCLRRPMFEERKYRLAVSRYRYAY